MGDKHLPSTVATQQDAWWMEDERQRQRSQSKVKSECYVKAGRPGLNHGLSRHHRAQVEGVEGLMSNVPQVVTRKGGMPAPRTRLQHLVDSKILSKKELTERYHASHEHGGQAQAVQSQRARKRAISSSGARRRPWSSKSPSCYALR